MSKFLIRDSTLANNEFQIKTVISYSPGISYRLHCTRAMCCITIQCAISFIPPQYYAFGGSEFNEAEKEIGGLITLIITRSCDLLNCKVHLNPPANYGMFCGGGGGGGISVDTVEMGLGQ